MGWLRRKRTRADQDQQRDTSGLVLLDNTTIFGARRAYEWTGATPPHPVDLRSLMDLLEAIVLFNYFGVDDSSRDEPAWAELSAVTIEAGDFYRDTDMLGELPPDVHLRLVETTADKMQRLVHSGLLRTQLGQFASGADLAYLPSFYENPDELTARTLERGRTSASRRGPDPMSRRAAVRRMKALARDLKGLSDSERRFAYFAFRGLYYQELAHLLSASYVPHSWRSGLIRDQLDNGAVNFGDFVLDHVGALRTELQRQIDQEFDTSAIRGEFPLIASYVASQSRRRHELLDVAVQIRQTRKATALREWITGINRRIRDMEDLAQIREAQEELRELVDGLARELGTVRQERQAVTLRLGVPAASVETAVHVTAPTWLRRVLQRRTHLVFLRELGRESTRIAPFGTAFQRLR